ncbi:branchpoint-bridging protein-like [Galendromus occidentalis]|uniref:Branchpoint-bridging protein-like n=1 Tax=Galendromus occidentalis TaxID=34638 RepID=A0AAJ7L429_9ACAR|nr:branchpoint-bridging protein-like [Galendromus occidentalis]
MKSKKPRGQEGLKTDTEQEKRRRAPRKYQGSVIVGIQNGSFAEVLKKLKHEVDEKELGVDISGVRQTERGMKLQVREKKTGGQARLAKYIEEQLKMKTQISGPALSTTVAVYNMDLVTTEDEIEESIRKAIRLSRENPIRVEKIRTNERGERSALVRLARIDADRLLTAERIKIGWQTCRIRAWRTVAVCFKCQEVGHRAHECKEKETKARRCYKCGKEGHLTRDCGESDIICQNCETEGHSKYSSKCPRFKELLGDQLSKKAQGKPAPSEQEEPAQKQDSEKADPKENTGTASQEGETTGSGESEPMQTEETGEKWKLVQSRRKQNNRDHDDKDSPDKPQ